MSAARTDVADFLLDFRRWESATHKPEFAGEWVPLDRAFAEVSRGVKKFGQNEYLDQGEHPIIDQGKNAIAGYSNEQLGMFKDVPAIVFGDHTRVFKYVDRPFFIGADGVKILKPLLSENVLFWYYALCAANIENLGYSRHFKLLKEKSFLNSSHEDQASITQILETVDEQISLSNSLLSSLDNLVKSQFVEMFGDPIEVIDGIALGSIALLKAGETTTSSSISNEIHDGLYPCYGGNGLRGFTAEYTHDGSYPLIGRQGALCGNVRMAVGKFKATEHAVVVQPSIEINRVWLFHYLRYDNLARLATGAAQPGLSVKNLNKVPVALPPLDLQRRFANFVAQVDKLGFDKACREP